jgi:hypothetical protein
MNQRSLGLTWLDSNDHEQQRWAHKYLQREGRIDQQHRSSTIDQLLLVGERLEDSKEGILILGKMRSAWRQVKCSASDKDKNRKTSAFKLRIDVKNKLTQLAERNQITAADMLGRLILAGSNTDDARHAELKAQLKDSRGNTEKLKETSAILMDLLENSVKTMCQFEIELQDARFSAEPSAKDQSRKVNKLYKQRMNSITDVITVRTRLSPKELFEQIIQKNSSAYRAAEDTDYSIPTQPARTQVTIDENPVAHPAPQNQQTPEAKPEPSSAATITNPPPNHPAADSLDMKPNDNASTDTPPQAPQTPTQERSIWLLAKTELGPHT